MGMETKFVLGKNKSHTPCSLGGRLIVVLRQVARRNFQNLIQKVWLGSLNRFMVLIALYQ